MIWVQSRGESQPSSKYLKDFVTLPSGKLITPDGIQIVKEFLIRFCATGITCVAENIACWLNDHRQMFPNEVAIWLPMNETIKALTSKQAQIEVARKVGFNVLPTYFIDKNLETVDHIPKNHFPLCLRPDDPASSAPGFKVHLVYSHDDLKRYIESLNKMTKPIIGQPFKSLPNLLIHGARTLYGKNIGIQAFIVERKFEGLALTVRPIDIERNLIDKCIKFTDYLDIVGCYHFDLIEDRNNNSTYFLEINSRLGGTTAKVFALGYDEPLLALQAFGVVPLSHPPTPIVQRLKTSSEQPATGNGQQTTINPQPLTNDYRPKNEIASSKQFLLKFLYCTIKNRLTALDYPSEPKAIRILKTIYGLLRYRDDIFTLGDIKGSVALYFGNLKSRIPI
jgi:hypothetical protein